MKLAARLFLVAAALCLIPACGNQEPPREVEVRQIRQDAEEKIQEADRQRLEADKARTEAEKARLEAERERKHAEKSRIDAEASKSAWQAATWLSIIAAIALLLVGVALGSSARKDSNAQKSPIE